MIFSAAAYASGGASFGAVNPIRAAFMDRNAADELDESEVASKSRALIIKSPNRSDPEATIRELTDIRAEALEPPRSAEELALAKLAHMRLIQAGAMLRAQEASEQVEAAQKAFQKSLAQKAYGVLDTLNGGTQSRLI
jgi:hypothetical protein